jgi:hypothetical protein
VSMTCHVTKSAIVCCNPSYRLRLSDGRHVFMAWHHYLGPMGFYKDRAERREIVDWFDDPAICEALDWFSNRGEKC